MRILVLENELSSLLGGQEKSLFEVCRGLARKGHAIILLYRRTGNLHETYRQFCEAMVPVGNFSIDRKFFSSSSFSFLTSLAQGAGKKFDLVYSNQYHDSFFGSILSKLKGVPFVCHLRLRPPVPICGQWKIGLRGVKRFIAVSRETKTEWTRRGYPEKSIDVVYNGVDTDFFRPNAERSGSVISYLGRLDREKGLETLIEAFVLLRREDPSAELRIAGKPQCHPSAAAGLDYLEDLKNLANQFGVGQSVRFLGHCADAREVYWQSDVIVLPTLVSESFGHVIAEAMACGVPVAASRIGGIPEVLGGEFSDGLFEAGRPDALVAVLQTVLTKKRRDSQLGHRCREHVILNFSLERTVDQIEELLYRTIGKSNEANV